VDTAGRLPTLLSKNVSTEWNNEVNLNKIKAEYKFQTPLWLHEYQKKNLFFYGSQTVPHVIDQKPH
jgi:predicted PP-loop superfamily ATPase